jgi:hypothetical protein
VAVLVSFIRGSSASASALIEVSGKTVVAAQVNPADRKAENPRVTGIRRKGAGI